MNEHRPFVPVEEYERDRQASASRRPLRTWTAASLSGMPVPSREWIVEGLIPAKTVTMLNGDGGTGKSLLALQLAAAGAGGGYWCGHEVTSGPCLFISAEDDAEELHRRLADIVRSTGTSLEMLTGLHLVSLAGEDAILAAPRGSGKGDVLLATPLFQSLEQAVGDLRPTIVVLDTLADMFAGDEVYRAHARQFIGIVRGLCSRFGTTVLLLAHPSLSGMASGSGTSGSTAWSNSVRSRLYLDRVKKGGDEDDPDLRVLRTKKANYGKVGDEIKLRWQDGCFKPEIGPDSLAVAATRSAAERIFLELLTAYTDEGRPVGASKATNFAPTVFAADERSGRFTKQALTAAMNSLFSLGKIKIEEYGPPSRRRQRVVAVSEVDQ